MREEVRRKKEAGKERERRGRMREGKLEQAEKGNWLHRKA